MEAEEFLEKKFREYYRENSNRIEPPRRFGEREYGFAFFKGRIMTRHRQFRSQDELRKFVVDSAPCDVYYSTAYYSNPEEEMEKKGWLGADLVFDIDADHIPTPCKGTHDHWTCRICGRSGTGAAPQVCPSCNSERFDQRSWICEICLREAESEALKLSKILVEDYGFSKNDLKIFFTGHRGYHIHIMSDMILQLDSEERKEIVDYVLGVGIDLEEIGILPRDATMPDLPTNLNYTTGWKKRIIEKLANAILNGDRDYLIGLGFRRVAADAIVEKRARAADYQGVRNVVESLTLRDSSGRGAMGHERWKNVLEKIVETCSAKVDTVVTTDVHRLIRAKETLNGRTGLRTVEVSVDQLEYFDPLDNAIGMEDGQETVEVDEAPEFRLGGSIFGPYSKQRVTLPTAAAVLLVCKGKAKPVT